MKPLQLRCIAWKRFRFTSWSRRMESEMNREFTSRNASTRFLYLFLWFQKHILSLHGFRVLWIPVCTLT